MRLGYCIAELQAKPRLKQAESAAADRYAVTVCPSEFDHAVLAGAPKAGYAVDIDDRAAVNADEATPIQSRFDRSDGERAEPFGRAVENIGVMGVGMDRDNVVDGND